MKKIAFLLVCIFTTTIGFSQKRKMHKAELMTAEQRATLTAKKLTLALDLNEAQAKKVKALYTKMGKEKMMKRQKMRKEHMKKREKLMKIRKQSKDQEDFKRKLEKAIKEGKIEKRDVKEMRRRKSSFEARNRALDHMITMQKEMKKILTKEQFEEYKKLKKHKAHKARKRVKRAKTIR